MNYKDQIMYQQIIFEEGKEPRLHTSHQDIKSIEISDNSGKVQEISVMEFKDTRGDVFYAYNYAYSGKKPSNDEIYKAIDELKPIGEKFEMSKTISDQ
ncbi:hypothetical protein EZQ28_003612 [Escherichia coli]|uniref:hypothetical protein n=1 Tax=Escherichia coli TaxID=562 RepID=UPI0011E9D4FB|nr:hypothetical protein [Escherichia coli]MEC9823333.1 hypothetical protein [Escherichia marmotae]EES6985970.1 hypothetical protein [Escherichia coli]EFH7843263.1 hypothetical protein [Escherichia coli]EFN8464087.1 hypothetical protein [Escherichia coli]EIG3998065.1 hypothetical protein [Escherichia coli]